MRIRNVLLTVLLVGSAGAGLEATTGCASHAYLVAESPPPPRDEAPRYRAGHVWVNGHWARIGGRWEWVRGKYVRERPGYVYVEGRWDRRPQGYVWIEGGWRQQDGVVVRRR